MSGFWYNDRFEVSPSCTLGGKMEGKFQYECQAILSRVICVELFQLVSAYCNINQNLIAAYTHCISLLILEDRALFMVCQGSIPWLNLH